MTRPGREFLRLSTLGILFAATMLAAAVVPRQIQLALQSSRAADVSSTVQIASVSSRATVVRRHRVRRADPQVASEPARAR